jgi:hypothetical protein
MANQQIINIGSQPNDGTGDSIYVAMQKINSNFNDIYTLLGFGAGFTFLRMKEAPSVLRPNAILQINAAGTKFENKILVGGQGMRVDSTSTPDQIIFINTSSNVQSDRNPILSNDLKGQFAFSLINMPPEPNADYDAVNRKWVFENFVNRNGTTRYDSTSSIEFFAGGQSTIRNNIPLLSTPSAPTHIVNKSYVDNLIDRSGYASKTNFYVAMDGDDARFDLPSNKRGRAFAYAFKTVNRAARAAEQYINAGAVTLGPYQKTITHAGGIFKSVVTEVTTSSVLTPNLFGVRLRVTLDPSSANIGTDPFINNSIFPGNYIVGASSEAVGRIEAIELDDVNGYEYYHVAPHDYAAPYNVSVSPVDWTNTTATIFTLGLGDCIDIPDFWIGQKFVVTNEFYNVISYGIVTDLTTTYDYQGNACDTVTVDFREGVALTSNLTIDANKWHVYADDYELSEELIWGQRQNLNQCTIMIESGQHEDQYPIKVPENCSIRGDEFRRSVIRPAPLQGTRYPGVSSSKWANTYFYRDAQIDGIITTQFNTGTDYASSVSITADSINNDPITDTVTFTLASGLANSAWIGKIFKTSGSADAQGEIRAVNNNTFEVSLAQNTVDFQKEINNYTVGVDNIASGDWHVYTPYLYGYHYLRDESRPMNVLNTVTNLGGHQFASLSLKENREFIQEECIAYLTATFPSLTYDQEKCRRDVGIIVDALVYDMIQSGWTHSVNAADSYRNVATVKVSQIVETTAAIEHIWTIGEKIIASQPVLPVLNTNGIEQTIDELRIAELGSNLVLRDLINVMKGIINNDPAYNPPKYNDEMDVFLMNDATINRYISCQGHGGFMKVLDPDGQILAKSPYTQTASSFSKSKNRQVFSGGMFIDGFAGNTIALPASITNDTSGYPVKINITATGGLGRPSIIPGDGYIKPQTPCFFVHEGSTYEVSFIGNYDPVFGTGSINLNPLRAGGISGVTNASGSGFRTGATRTIPVRFSNPTKVGGLKATGTATINSSGAVTAFTVAFPGSGYENGVTSFADAEGPKIVVGGARISWTLGATGNITAYAIIDGGEGYAVGTVINFPTTSDTATATVATVDANGAITGITISNDGSGYATDPFVTFGTSQNYTITVKPGFNITAAHPLPSEITLITAGNRSMLANDFTQMNDLGYGIFSTNGGLVENVSMFTYYCYSAYYSSNGGQCRSIAGSTSYGLNGLKSEGSDPLEVPVAVKNKFAMTQIASVVSTGKYTNRSGDFTIYIDNLEYAPLPQSQIEINHNGEVTLYNVKSATQDTDDDTIYSLSIDNGQGEGLTSAVADNTEITVRVYFNLSLLDLNAETLSRPSTVLTFNEDPSNVYRILSYTNQGADTALAEGESPYNYIPMTPYTDSSGRYAQGLGQITITNGGSGYTPSSTVAAVIPAPSATGSATVNGTQTDTDLITISGAANTIMIGSQVKVGGSDPAGGPTYVTWINSAQTLIRVSTINNWTNGASLTFPGIQAVGYGVTNSSGVITSLVLTTSGAGYASTAVRNITFASGSAAATAYSDGIAGTKWIKIVEIDATDEARINSGLSASTPYYYFFGFEGDIYKILDYKSSDETGNVWAEVQVERASDSAALQVQVLTASLQAGISSNQNGNVTSRISTMRVTGHDMLNVGTGGYADSKYPNDLYGPPINPPDTSLEVQEVGKGRVYYATTDQDGNFKVGKYFSVDQGRGTVSISAPISLTNVDGISFKRGQTLVQVFSVDGTMGGNSNNSVPTERAIQSYVNNRLGLNRNNTTAGVVPIGSGFLDLGGVREMDSNLKMGANRITGMADPVGDQDAVTKKFTQDTYVNTSGDTMVGPLGVSPNNTFWIGTSTSKWSEIHATSFRGTADTASKWANSRTVTFSGGDVTGNFSIDGSGDVSAIALTIAANSVALGTDTTGDYVSNGATSGFGVSGSTTGEGQTFTVTSNGTSTNTANTLVFRDGSGNFSANIATLTATQARYADLAEKYLPDSVMSPGTVVIFGGEKEIAKSSSYMDRRVAGVVSTDPAYMMNSDLEGGIYIALQGRVPCRVVGKIRKGDMLVTSEVYGVATASDNPVMGSVIGKALENYDSQHVGTIEVVVGRI